MKKVDRSYETLVSRQYRFRPEGESGFAVATLEISKPFEPSHLAEAGAAVRFVPFYSEWRVIHGIDLYQALRLAFKFVDYLVEGAEYRFELELILPGE
jgi:hypothetical protein